MLLFEIIWIFTMANSRNVYLTEKNSTLGIGNSEDFHYLHMRLVADYPGHVTTYFRTQRPVHLKDLICDIWLSMKKKYPYTKPQSPTPFNSNSHPSHFCTKLWSKTWDSFKKNNYFFISSHVDFRYKAEEIKFYSETNIVEAFRGMHVLPTKHSYVWLLRKCDYWTDTQTDAGQGDPYVKLCFAGDTKSSNEVHCEKTLIASVNLWKNNQITSKTCFLKPHKT